MVTVVPRHSLLARVMTPGVRRRSGARTPCPSRCRRSWWCRTAQRPSPPLPWASLGPYPGNQHRKFSLHGGPHQHGSPSGDGLHPVTHQVGQGHLEQVLVETTHQRLGAEFRHQGNILGFQLREQEVQGAPDDEFRSSWAKNEVFRWPGFRSAPPSVRCAGLPRRWPWPRPGWGRLRRSSAGGGG